MLQYNSTMLLLLPLTVKLDVQNKKPNKRVSKFAQFCQICSLDLNLVKRIAFYLGKSCQILETKRKKSN